MLTLAHQEPIPLALLVLGFTAQAMFFSRFMIQWIVSERRGRTVIPISFWYASVMGGMGLLVYGIFRRDPVIIVGQSVGLLVYTRNLMLIYRERREAGLEPRFPTAVDVPLTGSAETGNA
jgi:lipid-A-disaccharide synthase-like uncharacterized protein